MPAIVRPHLGMLGMEPIRAMLEYARMRFMEDDGASASGDGHAVVFFPGLGTDFRFTTPLIQHCKRAGFACHDWGRGINTGPEGNALEWLRDLAAEVAERVRDHQDTVSLVGWSLGGLYAREVAKIIPHRVRQVITIGSPIARVAHSTNVGWLYQWLHGAPVAVDRRLARSLRTPPPVPTTSIYSRSDGVVAWKACLEVDGPTTENIEVDSSHLGLVWHPEVLSIVAERLSQRAGAWAPRRKSYSSAMPQIQAA